MARRTVFLNSTSSERYINISGRKTFLLQCVFFNRPRAATILSEMASTMLKIYLKQSKKQKGTARRPLAASGEYSIQA